MAERARVLFLCNENACRSQMAEGILRYLAGERYEVFSAGTKPTTLNPYAIQVMAEIGINISGQRSKGCDEFSGQEFDFIITVCDSETETCPVFPWGKNRLHWSFPDPALGGGTEAEILTRFRAVRDHIYNRIKEEFLK